VCVVSSNYPDECGSAGEGADSCARLPFRGGGTGRAAHAEARAELRDRETYYAELHAAVQTETGPVPGRIDREGGDDVAAYFGDTWT
jgi:hypothetical protein